MESKTRNKILHYAGWTIVIFVVIVDQIFTPSRSRRTFGQGIWEIGKLVVLSQKLGPYEEQIKDCVTKAIKARPEAEKIIGIVDYGCAIDVAVTVYPKDKKSALIICRRHGLLREDSNVQQTACELSLKARMAKANASTTRENIFPPEALGSLIQNRKYGYRFGYPRGSRLVNMDDAVQNILYSRSVYVYDAHDKFLFGIDALDPEPLRSYPGFQETIKRYEWPLSSFADFIEKQNSLKNNPVTTTEMIGKTVAYEFWFDGSFHNGDASQILEPPRQAFFYVKPSRVILQIRFPAGFEPSEEIFASLELTDER